jgi:hypothetical protein
LDAIEPDAIELDGFDEARTLYPCHPEPQRRIAWRE